MRENQPKKTKAKLILENKETFEGILFGYPSSVSGEVVFNTGMVGYPETLTDPSYHGQILILTYPLIGNYGIPPDTSTNSINNFFESDRIHVKALIVSDYSFEYDHWNSNRSLHDWLYENKTTALFGINTRKLTQMLREKGTMLGKIIMNSDDVEFYNPNDKDLVSDVTFSETKSYGEGSKKILLIDCGCKNNIIRSLLTRKVKVIRTSANNNFPINDFDGIVISNGPGNPEVNKLLIGKVKKIIESKKPILGICLGHQILALAAGAKTYKLKYGHRSQNQPVIDLFNKRCFVTSQNHGYAVDTGSLNKDWLPWFRNLNDETNEGIKHKHLPFMSIQFHPEASPGPVDTSFIFDEFLEKV
ncbi:MAG: carbamoyl phosphate synthase small subunit [Ignavibacteria bacterium RBG_13_36_8]|nr:MAG: carbamoyl phosphate synthase small subunit [Ignavibacteria bacterium RBG_13_36_8]